MRCILVFRMSKAMQASAFEAWRSHSSRRLHNRRAVSQALGMLRNRALAEALLPGGPAVNAGSET